MRKRTAVAQAWIVSPDGKFTQEGVEAVLKTQRVANPEVGEKDIKLEDTYTNEFVE